MLYITKEHGEAMGALLSALASCGVAVEKVVLTQDSLEVSMSSTSKASFQRRSQTGKSGRNGKRYEFGGESLTVGEWAAKFGKTYSAMHSRLSRYGSPYGKTNGEDREKDKLV